MPKQPDYCDSYFNKSTPNIGCNSLTKIGFKEAKSTKSKKGINEIRKKKDSPINHCSLEEVIYTV